MKVGIRKPSLKRSIKARTTGKLKRKMKKTVNPLYGKKGMGWIKNPKKAMYNKVYNKTTISVKDIGKIATGTSSKKNKKKINNKVVKNAPTVVTTTTAATITSKSDKSKSATIIQDKKPIIPSTKNKTVAVVLAVFGGYIGLHRYYVGKIGTGILYTLTGGICGLGWLFDLLCLWVDQFEDKQGCTLLPKSKIGFTYATLQELSEAEENDIDKETEGDIE